MRSRKQFKRTLLIVCEGSETEPNYFNYLKSIALEKEIWSSISIYPIPKQEEGVTYQPNKRKKQKFKASKEEDNRFKAFLQQVYEATEAKQLYESYKSQPSRYVKEAQERIAEEGFDEAWAVFDQDLGDNQGTEELKKSFDLQNTPVKVLEKDYYVQIAFSSRSFEYWIILHFGKTILAYNKTTCKETIEKKDFYFDCGKKNNIHPKNCNGTICLVGYIRAHLYPNFEKSQLIQMMNILQSKSDFAIENASWLRFQMNKRFPKSPIYELNPYTNVDKLVKSILGIKTKYVWADLDEIIPHFGKFENVCVTFLSDNKILFTANHIISNPNNIHCYLQHNEGKEETLSIIETFEEARMKNSFNIKLTPAYKGKTLCIELENEMLILEL